MTKPPKSARLMAQRDELNRKIQRTLAREQRLERTQEAQRDSIVGRLVRARVATGRWPRDRFDALLDEDLTKPGERNLFGLPPLEVGDGQCDET